MDAYDKVDQNKYKKSKTLWKTTPKSLISDKSEQNNNIIQDKVNNIEDK